MRRRPGMADEAPRIPRAADARWHRHASGGPGPTGLSRRGKVQLLGGILLALLVVALTWAFLIRPMPDPHFLTVPVSEYHQFLYPVNAFAEQDSDRLLAHFHD